MTDGNVSATGKSLVQILIDLPQGGDPKNPKDYTFTDISDNPPDTVDTSGDIDLVTAGITNPTGLMFMLTDAIYKYAAWDASNPLNNIAVVEGDDCPPERKGKPQSLPAGWSAVVLQRGQALLLQDPNPAPSGSPPQPQPFDYRLNLKGRHGDSKHDVSIDPTIKNQPE